MFLDKNKYLLRPSGLNNRFYGDGLNFGHYIELMRDVIIETRQDLNDDDANLIIQANSPFCLRPNNLTSNQKNGVLLIHGLFDSPYYMTDLGIFFCQRDFLVQAILLPGHGTVPGDLLQIEYQHWLKAVQYGVRNLASQVEHIYLAGYSLGGVLALHHALQNSDIKIKGLLLFAPALQPKSKIKHFLAMHHQLFSWTCARAKWYLLRPQTSPIKYNSHSFNAGYQSCQILLQVKQYLAVSALNIPIFVVLSADDETISSQAVLSFFSQQQHPKSRLLLYSNAKQNYLDSRISVRPSAFPEARILNFSHTCLTIAPKNPILGRQASFFDLSHYPTSVESMKQNCYFGAASQGRLKKSYIARLSYNPDFPYLLNHMNDFLDAVD
jgi:esterase/lipase